MKRRVHRAGVALLLAVLAVAVTVRADPATNVAQLREQLFTSKDPGIRSAAAVQLLATDDPKADAVILETLQDPKRPAARVSVLKAIAIRADDRFITQVIGLLDDDDPAVAAAAAHALIAQKSDAARRRLIEALTAPGRPVRVRCKVAVLLADRRQLDAVEPLIGLLGAEEDALRRAALETLQKLTMVDFGFDRRAWSAWWAERKGKPREALLEEIIQRQAATLKERDAHLTRLWRRLLDALEKEKDPAPFYEALQARDFPEVQIHAVRILARRRPEGWVTRVAEQRTSPDEKVRMAIATALGDSGEPKAAEPVIALLKDPRRPVAAAAARALGRLKAKDAVTPLLRLLGSGDAETAGAAAEALGEIGDPTAVPVLSQVLLNRALPRPVREEAARALGKVRDVRGLQALAQALNEPDPRIRWSAADALGRLGLPGAVGPLAEVLKTDKDDSVRQVAALSLGRLGTKDALPHLLAGMDDPKKPVAEQSLAAVLALAGPGTKEYTALLEDLVQKKADLKAIRVARGAIERLTKNGQPDTDVKAIRKVLVRSLMRQQMWAEAREALAPLLTAEPKEAAHREHLITCSLRLGDPEAALQQAAEAVNVLPDKGPAWVRAALPAVEACLASAKPKPVLAFVDGLPKPVADALPADLKAKLSDARQRAAKDLAEAGQKLRQTVAALVRAMEKPGADREEAAKRLTALGVQAVPHLVAEGLGHQDPAVQDAVMNVLESVTGLPFNLPKQATPAQRAAAIKTWREQWRKKSSPAPPAGSPAKPTGPGAG